MDTVYITEYDYLSLEIEQEAFRAAHIPLIPTQSHSEDEIIRNCKDAAGLIVQYAQITEKIMANLPNLKVISRYGVGVDNIDLEAATKHHICVTNVPDYSIDEVSTQALALVLDCWRRVTFLHNSIHQGHWDYALAQPIWRLRGHKLGLVGFGKIAREVAVKAQAFGLTVLSYDPYVQPEAMRAMGVLYQPFHQLLRECDIISLHTPLTKETFHCIGTDELELMKSSAILINTARGPLVDEQALQKALDKNEIAGAGLDVLETEPISPDNPFLSMNNVVLTPHVAWYSEEANKEMKTKASMGIIEVFKGRIPTYLVNKDVLPYVSLR